MQKIHGEHNTKILNIEDQTQSCTLPPCFSRLTSRSSNNTLFTKT